MMIGYLREAYRLCLSEADRLTIIKNVHMIKDTICRKDECTLDLDKPADNSSPFQVYKQIPDPVSEVVPVSSRQLDAPTHFPEICG